MSDDSALDPAFDPAAWIGRSATRRDRIAPWPAQALHASLGRPGPAPQEGDPLPPFWRWLYFLDAQPPENLGRDGHPARGVGLTPKLPVPRRMWAGGRVRFHGDLRIGAEAALTSTVAAISEKTGRSGRLFFVTLRHETRVDGALIESEEQDLVYREDPKPDAPAATAPEAPAGAVWRRACRADPTLLFRYSALTFNGHRIHYDLDYARDVEGYAGLVVHGPLIATLLVGLGVEEMRAARPSGRLTAFEFRARTPIVHTEAFEICGAPDGDHADLWAACEGRLAMTARASFT